MSAVLTEVAAPRVLTIAIDRPEARNAVNAAVAGGIAAALDRLDESGDLAVGVLTGAGTSFCAGMDLGAFLAGEKPHVPGRGFAGIVERPPTKPLIAAVEGYALAGGFEIALACDLIVAASTATFGLPEVKRGLMAAGGGLLRLPRRIPHNLAMELALTGETLPAPRAAELGLVNRLSEPGEALGDAIALARQIAANAPLSLRATKTVLAESREANLAAEFERQRQVYAPLRASEDAKEGARAFKEKREPRWRGR